MLQNCMKRNVAAISSLGSLAQAARLFAVRHIGLLPVINVDGQVIGVLGLQDLLGLALPSFIHLVENFDFVQDFGRVEMLIPDAAVLAEAVTTRMRPATVVAQDSGLLRTYSLMLEHDLHDIPVVDADGKLVGIASRVDIGVAILQSWERSV